MVPRTRPSNGRAPGLTLIELLIYLALLALIGTPLTTIFLESSRAVAQTYADEQVERTNRAVLFRLAKDIHPAVTGSLQVSNEGRSLRFQLPLGYDARGARPGDAIAYDLEPVAPSATSGGSDGDGRLVRRNLQTDETIVVAGNVTIQDSRFALLDTKTVAVTMTNAVRAHRGSSSFVRQVSRTLTISLRN